MTINAKYSYNGFNPDKIHEIDADYKARIAARVAKFKLDAQGKTSEEIAQLQKTMTNDIRLLQNESSAEQMKYRTFKYRSFLDVPAEEFNDTEIVGSCFYQREPYTEVFPPDVKNVVLRGGNADNVKFPPGVTMIGGTHKQIKTQTDQEYWIVDAALKPIEPRDKARYIELGLSIDPKALPVVPLKEGILWTNDPKRIEAEKLQALTQDTARLKQILVDAGELPSAGVK